MCAGSCNDLIQSKEFLRKFLGESCCMEELGFDKGLTASLEFWSWKMSGVSRELVSTLSIQDVFSKFLMYFIKVGDKVTHMSRS